MLQDFRFIGQPLPGIHSGRIPELWQLVVQFYCSCHVRRWIHAVIHIFTFQDGFGCWGNSDWHFLAYSWATNWAWKGDEFTPNTTCQVPCRSPNLVQEAMIRVMFWLDLDLQIHFFDVTHHSYHHNYGLPASKHAFISNFTHFPSFHVVEYNSRVSE